MHGHMTVCCYLAQLPGFLGRDNIGLECAAYTSSKGNSAMQESMNTTAEDPRTSTL